MSLSATATADEAGVSAAVTATTAEGSGGHQQKPAEGHGGGDSGSSTVIGTTAAAEDPTSAPAIIAEAKHPIGQAATTGAARIRMARAATIKRRHKVKEFNDVISCYLCHGYLINATTVDYCVHSFCRSCIVRHLQEDKHCPQCRPGSKQIGLSNLKPDERLKALVFKLVPGLYQREHQRQQQFHSESMQSKSGDEPDDGAGLCDAEEEYFSPVEPISLSLEYHPESLQGCGRQQIPPIRYLQCPAAVTVHHLKRFISSKFDIDPDNERVDIEIIYEDEVLPEDFSLMDVGYCYSWKRVAPMRFFYRILVNSLCNKLVQVPSDSVVTEGDTAIEAKRAKKSNEAAQKSVRFKELNEKQTKQEQPVSGPVARDHPVEAVPEETNQTKYSIFKAKIAKTERSIATKEESSNNNNIEAEVMPGKIVTKVSVDERSQANGGKGPVKMTIIARKPNDIKVKHESSKNKTKSKVIPVIVPPVVEIPATTLLSDFKSLRSNDMRYSDYSLGPSGASVSSGGLSSSGKKSNSGKSKNISAAKEVSQKTVSKCDIVVSIPQSHVHRSSNSSDDSFENLSLAQLKTANKKSTCATPGASPITPKENIKEEIGCNLQKIEEKSNPDVPKLKIELPSLKTKITVPRKSPDVIENKKSPKLRKRSVEEQVCSPAINQVDLTTYAKNIGLKPIHPVVEEKDVKISPNNSPSSASSSTSSPPSTCGLAFNFSQDAVISSSHKKRKKAKHSKEPKEPGTKRRKLHAEIASQPAEESLKLKVKITANHKSHKTEKKLSSSSSVEEVTTPPAITTNPVVSVVPKIPTNESPAMSASTVCAAIDGSSSQNSIQPLPESKSTQESTKPTNRNKQGVNISNLNKALLEESSNINNLFKENSAPKPAEQPVPSTTAKQPVPLKPKVATNMGNKSITVTSVTIVTSAHTPSLSTVNQTQPKAIAPKIRSIQDSKIPISPPLPPSLFKTAPMTLQTISTTSTKPSSSQLAPRHTAPNDMRHMPVSQLKRLTNATAQKTQGNFVVPNPPKSLQSSPKLCPITSIASAANRQAAQLKRSASLDSNPPIIAKQQKLEHDRMIRKTSYTPFIAPVSTAVNITQAVGVKQQNNSLAVVTSALNIKPTEQQNFYTSTMGPSYTREVLTRKPLPILLPPSSISVTKMTDVIPSKLTHPSSAVTITPQQSQITFPPPQSQKPALEIVRISSNIPPIDQQPIAVISNNTVKPSPPKTTRPPPPPIPLVKIKRSVSQCNAVKPSITTVSAPVPQSSVLNNTKNIHTVQQAVTTSVATPAITPSASPVKPNTTAVPTSSEVKAGNGQSPMCDNIGALDLSGKSSRSPSQEKTSPTNSPPNTPTQTTTKDASLANKLIANNLEAALTKLKQQSSSSSRVSSPQTSGAQIATVSTTTSTEPNPKSQTSTANTIRAVTAFKTPKSPTQATSKESEASNGLQNLKMLSDSATNCEKIAIKNQRPIMPKLNEISKMRANPTVRQQNASVRNIPNPSALAFRSHQPIPMLASITKTTSPQKPTVSSVANPPVTTTTATATATNSTNISSSGPQKTPEAPQVISSSQLTNAVPVATTMEQPVPSATSASVAITTTATTADSSKLIGSKKSNLEQLAATLNLRALSAAADALKQSGTGSATSAGATATTNSTPEVASKTVSSTSPPQATASSASTSTTPSSESLTATTSLPSSAVYSAVTVSAAPTSPAVSATSA